MKYIISSIAFCTLVGCAQSVVPPPPQAASPSDQESTAYESGQLDITGGSLQLFRDNDNVAGAQVQTLSIRADRISLLEGEEKQYSFEGAHAVIYGKGEDNDPVIIEASRGFFVEDQRAHLQGGVKATMGALTMELDDLEWNNPQGDEPGIAKSDNPVRVDDPIFKLEAGTLRIYPDDKKIVLGNVTGAWNFGKEAQ